MILVNLFLFIKGTPFGEYKKAIFKRGWRFSGDKVIGVRKSDAMLTIELGRGAGKFLLSD